MTDIDKIKMYLQDSTWPFTRNFSHDVRLIEKEVLSLSTGLFAMSAYKTLTDEGRREFGLMIHSLAILLMFQLNKDKRRGIQNAQGVAADDAALRELSELGAKYMKGDQEIVKQKTKACHLLKDFSQMNHFERTNWQK